MASVFGVSSVVSSNPPYIYIQKGVRYTVSNPSCDERMNHLKQIVIVGAGMMGSALSIPACDNGHAVRIVGTHLDREIIEHAKAHGAHLTMKRKLPETAAFFHIEELETALSGADFVISGVSSFGVDWFLNAVLPHIPQGMPVLSVTKGLVDRPDGTLETIPHYLARHAGRRLNISAIGGPCTSYELADRRHSCVVFCGEDGEALSMLRGAMETPYYHISLSRDVVGVECAVALKNAYALAISSAIGMVERAEGVGCTEAYNPQAGIFGQSVREIGMLLALMGGGAENIQYAAGDLYVTVFGGRTRRLGILLGQGMRIDEALRELSGVTLESVAIATRVARALRALAESGAVSLSDYPILTHIDDVLQGRLTLDMPWQAFARGFAGGEVRM